MKIFNPTKTIYENGEFKVAIGIWGNSPNHLAMRWYSDKSDDNGYPNSRGNEMWFLIANDLKDSFIEAIVNKHTINEFIKTKENK